MITDKPARLTDLSQFKIIINGNDVTGAIAECHIWQDIFIYFGNFLHKL